jgi:SAM-dependent methyltransferase
MRPVLAEAADRRRESVYRVTRRERTIGSMRKLVRRAAWSAAVRTGLQVYEPNPESLARLDELTEYVEDHREIGDERPTTATDEVPDLTLLADDLGTVVDVERFRGARVLEVGPKYGIHARWIDQELKPSELVFSDFEADTHLHEKWVDSLERPYRFVYGDLRLSKELLELEPFDLVFFLGVLYHSIHHLPLLGMLNRVTKPGGTMLFETSVDPRPDALVRLRWPENGKAKGVPTIQAVRLELAWTGWRKVVRFIDYRPDTTEALFLCEKTDELRDGADLSDVVTPHRPR